MGRVRWGHVCRRTFVSVLLLLLLFCLLFSVVQCSIALVCIAAASWNMNTRVVPIRHMDRKRTSRCHYSSSCSACMPCMVPW